MSTVEIIAFISVCILAGIFGGLLIIRMLLNSKAWQSIAMTIKEDYEKAGDSITKAMADRMEWQLKAIRAENAYTKQSERMAAIVAENQSLRRSNAQLKRREGAE